jgi:putative DNA primase/helicase
LRGGTEPAEVRQAIEQVRLVIEQHGESRFEALDEVETKPVINRLGWRKGSGVEREWWVPPQVWKVDICEGLDPVFVARTLHDRGILRTQDDGKLQCVVNIRGHSKRAYVLTSNIFGDSHAA